MGLPMTAKKLHKITNQDLIDDEVEAVDGYQDAIEESDNPEAIEVYEHIKGEEEEHIAELEGLDKMKAEDITSEQAWEDFKAGYSDFEEKHIGKDREGDQASLDQKIDIMNAKLTELNTDVARLNDSIPQALGTIEEGKTIEEEVEQEGETADMENPEAEGGEDDLFGGEEDDGLDGYFSEGDEESADDESADDKEETAEGDEDFAEDSDMETEKQEDDVQTDETSVNADGESDGDMVDVEDESGEAESEGDDDFIAIDDIEDDGEDESDDDEQEEVLEKMVRILTKMDKRLTRLERENEGLKKQLSKRITVQTEATNMAKSRPRPNTNLRLVKGSYNRPPVSTQYVANQRDIGVGVSKGESSGQNVFRQGLNEVFEECNRIANETH